MDKMCSKCKVSKPLEQFPRGKKYTDGRRGVCKTCDSSYSRVFPVKEGEYECNMCNKILSFTEFYKCSQNKNGLRTVCKSCNPINNFKYKYDTNSNLRIAHNLRTRIRKALKLEIKSANTIELLGCPIQDLTKHLESKFTEGMTWENYGKWHIDHIRPCASFNLEDPEEQKRCFHWTNLQPLWARDNIVKGSRVEP